MACSFFKGRTDPCKSNIAGLKRLYITDYTYYPRWEMQFDGNTLTDFPNTIIHEFSTRADGNTFTQNRDISGKHTQSVNLVVFKQDVDIRNILSGLMQKNVRVITEENNGTYRIWGLDNGLQMKFTANSGGAKSDFNGYNVTFSGLESMDAPYIDDLQAAGFFPAEPETEYYQFQDFQTFQFQDGQNITF